MTFSELDGLKVMLFIFFCFECGIILHVVSLYSFVKFVIYYMLKWRCCLTLVIAFFNVCVYTDVVVAVTML